MRDILFRGKDKDDGKWYEGAYRKYEDTTYCFKEDYDRHPENTHHTIVFSQMTDWGLPNRHLQAEVLPETVGQYTGYLDMNGKKIFEDDIVEFYFYDRTRRNGEIIKVKNTCTMLIEFKYGMFRMVELFRNYRLDENKNVVTEKIYKYRNEFKEGIFQTNDKYFVSIIGNKWDTPELLEVEML